LSSIDGDHKYNELYAGTTQLARNDNDKVEELVKEL
jgi:hypothetical protein